MPARKRAHMLSRGYLELFTNDRGLVFVIDKEHPDATGPRSPGNAMIVSYGYRTELTTFDLEDEYSNIESDAIPAIRNLAHGGTLNREGDAALMQFLDMYRERAGFADAAKKPFPVGEVDMVTGNMRIVNPGMGDRIGFSRVIEQNSTRIRDLPHRNWRRRVAQVEGGLITGDGAVLLWGTGRDITAVTFPLSPTRLLVIGSDLDGATVPLNGRVLRNSRRWIVGQPA